ncbi:MAG: zf-HC2 domain-containing protein [Chloroflexi bacterium]|nr:zf-HC2 domain-containing protein [Chloroflexota bacterium]
MAAYKKSTTGHMDCATCQAHITEYVDLELSGTEADAELSSVAFHIETCPACETAYYQEFRAQGLRKSVSELQRVGHREWTARSLDRILRPAPSVRPEPARDWIEQGVAQGRAWLEPLTERWREVQVYLGRLLTGPDLQPAYALSGLMGEGAPAGLPVSQSGHFAPEQAPFELTLVVTPEPATIGEKRCRLEVVVTLRDALGDYSGMAVTLLWGDQARTGTTDSLGKLVFENLPSDDLPIMSLIVTFPD